MQGASDEEEEGSGSNSANSQIVEVLVQGIDKFI